MASVSISMYPTHHSFSINYSTDLSAYNFTPHPIIVAPFYDRLSPSYISQLGRNDMISAITQFSIGERSPDSGSEFQPRQSVIRSKGAY